jgi:diacylglycerol kinase (ATP)
MNGNATDLFAETNLPLTIFVNRQAGGGRFARRLSALRAFFEQQRRQVRFVETRSREELQQLADQALAAGARVLAAMGGDGTLQGLAQFCLGKDVRVGIVPAGGGNDFAAALGIPLDPLEAAKVLLTGEMQFVDVVSARMADGSEHIYLGGGGIGLDADAARLAACRYYRWPGRLRYVASALHALRNFAPLSVCAEFPDDSLPPTGGRVLLACILNSPTYGSGLRFSPGGTINDGLVEVTLLEDQSTAGIMKLLPRLLTTGEIRTSGMRQFRCSWIRLIPDRPCMFHGDGEVFGPAPVEIRVLPSALPILTPRRN